MKNARYTAVQALLRMESASAYSNLVIDSLCTQNKLDPRDTAFAGALFFTTLERRISIDSLVAKCSSKPLDALTPVVRAVLRTGVCQIVYLGGVDDYAAVNESVNLVKELGAGRASGFVNGVLRAILRLPPASLPGTEGAPADDLSAEALSVRYSCPVWLVKRWLEAYGIQAAIRILVASLGQPPLYLRANTLRISGEELAARLEEEGVSAQADAQVKGCVLARGKVPVEKLRTFTEGLFHVQDRASQLCVETLDPRPGERVLDVCAAPGGKSFTAAQAMKNEGELVARDLHQKRVRLIRQGAERLGLECITASEGDASVFDPGLGLFDRVLCDVPCSGFGIIRRKPEIKYKPLESVQNLPEIQYKILETSAHYLKTGGILVYSTCTLLPEENERVVERFLAENSGFTLKQQVTRLGEVPLGDDREALDCDGFFTAAIVRD